MTPARVIAARAVACLSVTCLAAACGSGTGDSPAGAPPPLAGDYHMIFVFADTPTTMAVGTGTASSDGAGTLLLTGGMNEDGVVTPFTPAGASTSYTVDAAGNLALGSPRTFQGGLSADGSCAVLSRGDAGPAGAAVMVLLREGATFSDASLDTTYHLGLFGLDLGGPAAASAAGTVLFDGAGAWSGAYHTNTEGLVLGPIADSDVYTVSADGALEITVDALLRGGLSEGATWGIVGGDVAAGDPVGGALVRAGSGLSESTLSGTWWCSGVEWFIAGGAFAGWRGTLTADGTGSAVLDGEVSDGTSVTPFSLPVAYTVAADGALVMNRGPGEDLTGGVTADGRFAFVTGGLGAGSDPVFFVLCRK